MNKIEPIKIKQSWIPSASSVARLLTELLSKVNMLIEAHNAREESTDKDHPGGCCQPAQSIDLPAVSVGAYVYHNHSYVRQSEKVSKLVEYLHNGNIIVGGTEYEVKK